MAVPGKIAQWGAKSRLSLASKRMRPQVGMSGGKPRPRKDSDDSAMIAAATSMVPATMTGPRALGRMWRMTWRKGRAPRLRAASTNSFSRRDRNWARTSRATGIQRRPPITATIRMKTPASGPEDLLQRVAEQIHDEEQERELGQRQEEIGEAHERVIHPPAGMAGDGADRGAHADGDEHGGHAHRERDAPAVEHPRQEVLPQVVGAERVRPRGPFSLALKSMSLMGTR